MKIHPIDLIEERGYAEFRDACVELPSPLEGEARVDEGLRLENSGLTTQREAAIAARGPHGRMYPDYENGVVVRLGWDFGGARV